MGGKGKDIDDTKDWPKANEVTLIQILVGKVREGKLQSSTFKKEVWAEINNEMHDAIGVDYGIDRLKGKFNRLRIKYRHFFELVGHTGVKWDVTSNTVHASQDIWEGFFKKNKEFKKFKKQGCEDYDLLGEIFNTTTAIGKLQQLSTEDPLSPIEERHLEEKFLSGSIHVDLEGNSSEGEGSGKEIEVMFNQKLLEILIGFRILRLEAEKDELFEEGERENEQEFDDTEATSYGSNEEHVTFDMSQTAEMAQVRDEIATSLWTGYRQN
ncbi:hypothetical protein V6N13_030025 [Hibiscus sabdariffa]